MNISRIMVDIWSIEEGASGKSHEQRRRSGLVSLATVGMPHPAVDIREIILDIPKP